MISYVMVGSNDLKRSKKFYLPVLDSVGFRLEYEIESQICWAHPEGGCKFIVTRPYDGQSAEPGNGTMASFALGTKEAVDSAYNLAIEAGGEDEGMPGLRGRSFYGAYFRDPDGNKIAVHTILQP